MVDYPVIIPDRRSRPAKGDDPPTAPRRGFSLIGLFSSAVGVLLLLPVVYLVIRALQADDRAWSYLLSVRTLATLGRTVSLAFAVTTAAVVLAVLLAWLTVRTDLPFRRMWSVLLALPLVIPSYVGAYLMVAALGPRGILAGWLKTGFGISRLPSIYGFPGALIVLTFLSYPYILLTVRAALKGLDPDLEDAARVLGHGPWKTFWRVTFPHLRPAIGGGGLLVALYVLRDFGAVSIMRYNTFTRVIYVQYQSTFDRSGAAGLALVLVLVTLTLLTIERRGHRRANYPRGVARGDRRVSLVQLNAWRWPALLFCGAVVAATLIVPVSVLLYWLGRGLQAGEQLRPLWDATRGSLLAALLAAGVTVVAALPIAIYNVRFPGRLSHFLERLTYAAFALPGIVIALALVFFGAKFVSGFYQTLPMLILAYMILFIPQAVGAARTSMLQIPPAFEEAARSLGHRPLQVFRRVTLPLVQPGVWAGAALVFLTTMKELPATLVLSPLGYKTLATGVWSAVSEAFFARAAAPALVLVLISSLPMVFMILRERK